MNCLGRLTSNPERCGGRPCVRGMRIRVKDLLDRLAAGVSGHEIREGYPGLEADDVKACLRYAAAQSRPCRASGGVKFILDARL
jgi:uncharacterized protein (DUF433 family)